MKLGFKRLMNKGQKGVTLVELMVVMAILATLAAIVFPAVSGTSETSANSQVKTDAGLVQSGVNDFFADQDGAAEITTDITSILGASNVTDQKISTRYPETYLTTGYAEEFPPTTANVTKVNIKLNDAAGTSKTAVELANGWNAVNFSKLVDDFIPSMPKSATSLSKTGFNNYLWLVDKTGDADVNRNVAVFKLTKVVDSGDKYELTYEQVY